jgi:hypothetical protein
MADTRTSARRTRDRGELERSFCNGWPQLCVASLPDTAAHAPTRAFEIREDLLLLPALIWDAVLASPANETRTHIGAELRASFSDFLNFWEAHARYQLLQIARRVATWIKNDFIKVLPNTFLPLWVGVIISLMEIKVMGKSYFFLIQLLSTLVYLPCMHARRCANYI